MMLKMLFSFLPLLFILSCSDPAQPDKPAEPVPRFEPVPTLTPAPQTPPPTFPLYQTAPFDLAYIMGKFDPATHPDFTQVDLKYADREGLFLRKDTYESFQKMWAAARADGIQLTIKSATRNFDYQKGIWERKWRGETKIENGKDASKAWPDPKDRALAILRFSSMPGTSRHHWGTDIDLNDFENSYFETGTGLKEYEWLVAHGADYGFCQVYTEKNDRRPEGYEMEKWHWSYLPVARPLTDFAKNNLKDSLIAGFAGAEAAPMIGVVEKYVLGINPDCQ